MTLSIRRTVVCTVVAAAVLALTGGTAAAQDAGHAKPAVVRDSSTWLLNDQLEGGSADRAFTYGNQRYDAKVMGDWDGDGVRTPGVIRTGGDRDGEGDHDLVWHLTNDNDGGQADIILRFGDRFGPESRDTPIVGDWDGDGTETVGVVRRNEHPRAADTFTWLLRNSNTTGPADVSFDYGRPYAYATLNPREHHGDPVVGDWDGDGTTTPGVVYQDPPEGTSHWALRNSNSGGTADITFAYGTAEDAPVVGDWNGDGTETPGVIRGFRTWLLRNSNDGGTADRAFTYGETADLPVVWG